MPIAVKDLDVELMGSRDAGRLTKIRERLQAIKDSKGAGVQLGDGDLLVSTDMSRVI